MKLGLTVPYRLLIIGDQPNEAQATLDQLLPVHSGFDCEHHSWDPFTYTPSTGSNAQLIVALALAEPPRATSLLQRLHTLRVRTPILAVLPDGADKPLVRLALEMADDFVFWPLRGCELQERVAHILGDQTQDEKSLRQRLAHKMALARLVGKDPAFLRAIDKISLFAASDAPVLLSGETGTGKELCARAIHHLSPRSSFPFVPVECGAVPEHLAENEIFGHMRGAFTDAHADQKGLVAMADHGTLFLDEVDGLVPAVQAKLLRLLEEGSYRPLGGERFACANARVIAATNRDLEFCIREAQFRSDLYFRLKVLQLHLPALRERRGDIGLLARHALETLCEQAGVPRKAFSPSSLRLLERYDWPGNIRELFNVVQAALVVCPDAFILPHYISLPTLPSKSDVAVTRFQEARQQAIETFERRYLAEILARHHGNISRAAAEAGKDRWTFGRLVKKYGVELGAL
jgi:two-component system, NtrC family, response regulator GlrR